MSTPRQRILAENIVKNAKRKKPLNKKELLVSSGYSEISAVASPGFIINQKGVQEELENLGFNADSAKRVVAEILGKRYAEDKDRLKAAEIIFKVTGDFAPEKHINLNVEQRIISIDE